MITKKILAPLVAVVFLAGICGILTAQEVAHNQLTKASRAVTTTQAGAGQTDEKHASSGRYEQYAADKVGETGYTNTILFFYAAWCPECRAFKQAITSENIPDGVQVLEVNYDSSSDLKKKYGVTLQSTFVKVDSSGSQVSKWIGYGKNKSLETILDNL